MAIMGLLLALSSWFALIWVDGGFKTTLSWITLGLGAVVFITSWMLHRRYERRHGPFYSVGYRPKGKGSKFSPVNHGNRS